MDGMRHVPVDREAPAAAYLRARRLLREGEAVCAFPEAGISYSFTVRSLMRGVAALARETGRAGRAGGALGQPADRLAWASRSTAAGPRPDLRRGRLVDVRFGAPMPVARGDDLVDATRELGARLDRDARGAAAAARCTARARGSTRRGTPRTWAGTRPTGARRCPTTDVPRVRGPAHVGAGARRSGR